MKGTPPLISLKKTTRVIGMSKDYVIKIDNSLQGENARAFEALGLRCFAQGLDRALYNRVTMRHHPVAGWSSLVARRAHNPKVRGSNPLPATIKNQRGPESRAPFSCYLDPTCCVRYA